MRPFSPQNKFGQWILGLIRGYNHNKYWKRRAVVIDPDNHVSLLKKLYYLWYVKRVDCKQHCSFGTNLNQGSTFATPPILPHGPNGIIVGYGLEIGRDVIIYQQVTIASGGGSIGNHVYIGPGAKILPGVNIGDYAKIGANAVVIEDVPPHATCVLQRPRIIIRK